MINSTGSRRKRIKPMENDKIIDFCRRAYAENKKPFVAKTEDGVTFVFESEKTAKDFFDSWNHIHQHGITQEQFINFIHSDFNRPHVSSSPLSGTYLKVPEKLI